MSDIDSASSARRLSLPGYVLLAFASLSAWLGASAPAATPEQVDTAIHKAVAHLYSCQKANGQWEGDETKADNHAFGGYTALVVLSLLEAGEKPTDPRIVKGIDFLKRINIDGNYSLGLRCMVYSRLNQTSEIKRLLQDDVNHLLRGQLREQNGVGMWGYDTPSGKQPPQPGWDRSVSQFAVLGLWAGVQAGATVQPTTWRVLDTVWRNGQNSDGSWSYFGPGGEAGGGVVTMTAAGAATLLIVQDVLGSLGGSNGIVSPSGQDESITKSLRFLSTNFPEVLRSGGYGLYGVERISTAGGFRYIGEVDWYAISGSTLVESQMEDGSWGVHSPGAPPSETALCLLTLAHGRAPVLVSKLNYSGVVDGVAREAPWHTRPRDAANLVRFVGRQLEQIFAWQVVSFAASSDELLESPVLLIAGSKELAFSEKERAKLRGYLEGGGFIICMNDGPTKAGAPAGSDPFSKSVVTLSQQLYPERSFRELPANHPIFTDQQFRANRWTDRPPIWGLSNGVRELMVLLPQGDLGRAWNANRPTTEAMKWELGSDLCQYATSRMPLMSRGRSHVIKPAYWTTPTTRPVSLDGRPPSAPGTQPTAGFPTNVPATQQSVVLPPDSSFMTVGRLNVGENWDPEPGAWPRIATLLANNFHVFVDYRPTGATDKELAGVKLLHWTGTTAVKLTAAQRTAIANFLNKGGTLLVDAAGGSAAFADSAQAELNTIFSGSGKEFGTVIAPDDQVFRLRDARIGKVTYRRFMAGRVTGALDVPRLRGFDRGGRTIVFLSREDLTAGCVGQSTDGILGYSPTSATEIVRNIALMAARKK